LCRVVPCFCFFFFSSRRRHTRSKRDWSSDVCSSDLTPAPLIVTDQDMEDTLQRLTAGEYGPMPDVLTASGGTGISPTDQTVEVEIGRACVGKEGRCGGWANGTNKGDRIGRRVRRRGR